MVPQHNAIVNTSVPAHSVCSAVTCGCVLRLNRPDAVKQKHEHEELLPNIDRRKEVEETTEEAKRLARYR